MSRTATYHTTVSWLGEHRGQLAMGNGPCLEFSAPPDAHGKAGVLTPEDAFVGAANSCLMLMFIWAAERHKLRLLSYECRAEGTKVVALDRTEKFVRLWFQPIIRVARGAEAAAAIERRIRQALTSAQKYSLVLSSVKSEIVMEPQVEVVQDPGGDHG